MNRFTSIVFVIWILVSDASLSAQDISLESIINAHIKAVGGKQAIQSIESFERVADVTMSGNFGTLEGTFKEIVDVKNRRYFSDLDFDQFRKTDAMSGNAGRTKGTQGDRDMADQELQYAKMSLGINPLIAAHESSPGFLKVEGIEKFNGQACHKITFISAIQFFVNVENSRLEGQQIAGVMTNVNKQFEVIDGVQFVTRREMKIEDQGVALDFKYKSTNTNLKIDDQLFAGIKQTSKAESVNYSADQIMNFLDKDGDEKISEEEAQASPQLATSFNLVDTNMDGFIDIAETQAMVDYSKKQKQKPAKPPGEPKLDVQKFIEMMDKDADGKISKREANVELQPFFNDLDTNKDGFVDEREAQVVVDYVNGSRQ